MKRSLLLLALAALAPSFAAAAPEKVASPPPGSVATARASDAIEARVKSILREVDAWERSVALTRQEYRTWLQERAVAKKINSRSPRESRIADAPSPLNLNDSPEAMKAAQRRETEEAERTAFELKHRLAEESAAREDAESLRLVEDARRRGAREQKRRDAETARKLGGRMDESGQFVDPDLQK